MDREKIERAARTLPELVISHWPGPVGRKLREAYWRTRLGRMGRACAIDVGVVFQAPENVFLGDNVWLDSYVQILAGAPSPRPNIRIKPNPAFKGNPGEIHVGSNVHIAPFCVIQGHGGVAIGSDSGVSAHSTIYSLSHHYRGQPEHDRWDGDYAAVIKFSPSVPPEQQVLIQSPVVMEDATGVGLHSALLPGATIRRFSWVGVGSVVMGEVPSGVIAGGNPLRIIKARFGSSGPH